MGASGREPWGSRASVVHLQKLARWPFPKACRTPISPAGMAKLQTTLMIYDPVARASQSSAPYRRGFTIPVNIA